MISPYRYRYLGPPEQRRLGRPASAARIDGPDTLGCWLAGQTKIERAEPFTFVVDGHGDLWLAPRRSEHVACAQGADVFAAGEIQFERDETDGWIVSWISNQSAGYCPDLDSWMAVADALGRAGLTHPDGFTAPVLFRGCQGCGSKNVVRDDNFVCALCGSELPLHWNLGEF